MADKGQWRCFAEAESRGGAVEVSRELVEEQVKSGRVVWVDILGPTRDDLEALKTIFGFHDLALSDLLNNMTRPKQETYGDVMFTVFRAINFNPGEDALDTINLNLFLTPKCVVSTHCKPLRTVTEVYDRVVKDQELFRRGTAFLYYSLLDGVVDRYLDVIDQIENDIDELEYRVFQSADSSIQERIFGLKKRVTSMRRLILPEREALQSLVHAEFPQIDTVTRTHLRDVLDHVLRVQDLCDSYRDLLMGLMDSYMTQLSNRMNQIMKLLSIISTIMLPLGFLTGLFGMNFDVIPLLHSSNGFWVLLLLMAILVGFMFWMFRKTKIL